MSVTDVTIFMTDVTLCEISIYISWSRENWVKLLGSSWCLSLYNSPTTHLEIKILEFESFYPLIFSRPSPPLTPHPTRLVRTMTSSQHNRTRENAQPMTESQTCFWLRSRKRAVPPRYWIVPYYTASTATGGRARARELKVLVERRHLLSI